MFRSNTIKGITIGLVATLMHALVSVISKLAYNVISRDMFLAIMYGVATFVTAGYMEVTKRTDLFRLQKKQLWPTMLASVFYFIVATTFFISVQLTNPSLASFFGRFQTVYIDLLGVIFLKERLSRGEVLGMAAILSGAVIITYASGQNVFIAFLLALLGESLFNALGIFTIKIAVNRGTSGVTVVFWRSFVCFVLNLFSALVRGRIEIPGGEGTAWSVLAAVVGPVGTFILFAWALRSIEASKLGIIRAIQPVFTVLLSLLILNTIPTVRQMIGGVVALAGVMIIIQVQMRLQTKPQENG